MNFGLDVEEVYSEYSDGEGGGRGDDGSGDGDESPPSSPGSGARPPQRKQRRRASCSLRAECPAVYLYDIPISVANGRKGP